MGGAWEVTFTLESECKLPSKCRPLGVSEEDRSVIQRKKLNRSRKNVSNLHIYRLLKAL
ncbi:hypothetical protein LguiA_014921 [Lonicera macranthoides]